MDGPTLEVRLVPAAGLPQRLRVPAGSVILRVPASLGRRGISGVLNHLLFGSDFDGEDDDVAENDVVDGAGSKRRTHVVFDCAVEGKLLRETLDARVRAPDSMLSSEVAIEVTYFEALPPPRHAGELEEDDWISSLDGSVPGFCATGSYDGVARIWSLASAETATSRKGSSASVVPSSSVVAECRGHEAAIKSIVVLGMTDKSIRFATASQDQTLRIWEAPTTSTTLGGSAQPQLGTTTAICAGHTGTVECVDVCPVLERDPEQQRLCSGGWDGVVHIWRAGGSTDSANSEAAAGEDPTALKKRRRVAIPIAQPLATLQGHTQAVRGLSWVQPTQVVTAGYDHSVRVWDASTQQSVHTMHGASPALTLSYHGGTQLILTGHVDSTVRLWDPRVHSTSVASQVVSGDSFFAPRAKPGTLSDLAVGGHVSAVAWQPTSQHVYMAASHAGIVKLFDVRSPVALHTMREHEDKVFAVGWASADTGKAGKSTINDQGTIARALSVGADKKLRMWDVSIPTSAYSQ